MPLFPHSGLGLVILVLGLKNLVLFTSLVEVEVHQNWTRVRTAQDQVLIQVLQAGQISCTFAAVNAILKTPPISASFVFFCIQQIDTICYFNSTQLKFIKTGSSKAKHTNKNL